MEEKDYSAGLTHEIFWLQESRKTAEFILEGKSKAEIKEIAWEENIYQVRAEYRATEVLNCTYRRLKDMPEDILRLFTTCDVTNAKLINLIAILKDSRFFFEFMYEVFDEKLRLGDLEITDRDLNEFMSTKAAQSEKVASWTDAAQYKLKQVICRMLLEAGLLEDTREPRKIRPAFVNFILAEALKKNDMEIYLNAIKGAR